MSISQDRSSEVRVRYGIPGSWAILTIAPYGIFDVYNLLSRSYTFSAPYYTHGLCKRVLVIQTGYAKRGPSSLHTCTRSHAAALTPPAPHFCMASRHMGTPSQLSAPEPPCAGSGAAITCTPRAHIHRCPTLPRRPLVHTQHMRRSQPASGGEIFRRSPPWRRPARKRF